MDYEVFAPDLDDECFDEACDDAWTKMFNRGYEFEDSSWIDDLYCNLSYS